MATRNIHRELDFQALIDFIIEFETKPITTPISIYLRRHSFMEDQTGTPSDDIEKLKMAEVFRMLEDLKPEIATDYDRDWLKAILAKD